jgi:hypothetical protein
LALAAVRARETRENEPRADLAAMDKRLSTIETSLLNLLERA